MDPLIDALITELGLIPHPSEGGYFRETWRAAQILADPALSQAYGGPRCAGTAIYYLLTPQTLSAMHRVRSDEIFHFYLGDAVEQLRLTPGGKGEIVRLGSGIAAGERPQSLVPHGTWQGARLKPGGRFALMGCTVSPGFEFADYEHGDRASLTAEWPEFAEMIATLTPADPVARG
ncbi:cupin domain-containing protein [Oleispirillum naphthae]|uniref:cupin domain-containing protein n=1 Tax=Oleispirillum naphthae TaxID=2838853 RepID=UPI00308255C2